MQTVAILPAQISLTGDHLDAAVTLGVAAGIGLLVGAERERRKGSGKGRAAAGVRTFALVGLLGGLSAVLGGEAALLVAGLFVVAAAALSYVMGDREDPGITTEVALVVVFLLGALAEEAAELAAAVGVAITILLASRQRLHRFVSRTLTEDEVHDFLLFAGAAMVVLPLVPNEAVGPFGVFNPFRMWLLVVLVMGVSGAGYVAMRAAGPSVGLALSGLAAGFVSSSATIGAMGTRAREQRALLQPCVAGAVLSTVATVVQMALVVGATNEATLRELGAPLALGGIAATGYGMAFAIQAFRGGQGEEIHPGRAFSLRTAMVFASTLTAILFLAAALQEWLGEDGVAIAAAAGGFADTHAPAISVATLVANGRLTADQALMPILLAFTTNSLTKIVLAMTGGGRRFALRVVPGVVLVLAAAWGGSLL